LSHVISRLLNKEVRQISGSQSSNPNDTLEEIRDEAMAVTGQRGGGRWASGGTPSDVVCFFCDKKGHYKSDCPERLAWENAKTKKESNEYTATVFDEDFDEDGVGF